MAEDTIKFDVDSRGIAKLTLNRPEVHNAFDDTVIKKLTELFVEISNNSDIRALLITATGKSFCAGADLNWMKRMANYSFDENLQDAIALANMLNHLKKLPIPTIAPVQGAAFGGGVGLLCCCDIVFAAEDAKFCFSEVKIGLSPATISPHVIAAIGERQARRYLLSAEMITAEKALQIGLIHEVIPINELEQQAEKICTQLLANSPDAIKQTKKLIERVLQYSDDKTLTEDTAQHIANIRVSQEGQEGLQAFFDKRSPNWKK